MEIYLVAYSWSCGDCTRIFVEVCDFIHSSLSCTVSTSPPHQKHTSYYFLSLLLKKMSDVLEVDYFSLTLSQLFIFLQYFLFSGWGQAGVSRFSCAQWWNVCFLRLHSTISISLPLLVYLYSPTQVRALGLIGYVLTSSFLIRENILAVVSLFPSKTYHSFT